MPIGINGSGTITGLSVGGLPDGTVNADDLASGAVTQVKLGTGVAGNGPAFSAYGSAFQSTSNTTYTKTAYNTVEFDTNSNYDTTNRRFTPTVAGYYLINTVVAFSSTATAAARGITAIYKNGSSVRLSSANLNSSSNTNILNSAVIYMNGTTDYIEIFMYQDSGGALNCGSSGLNTSFSGCLVRAA